MCIHGLEGVAKKPPLFLSLSENLRKSFTKIRDRFLQYDRLPVRQNDTVLLQ